ncbi:MAG: HAD-IA family hydrolase [Firmicutes bacterium]|nr:HAD-IA family hydrolase [Bacillota bacterium]
MINTILWDFDGTLLNTNDVILESWQHTYEHYYNRRMPIEHITKCFGEPLLVTMAREFPDVPPKDSAEVYREFQKDIAYVWAKAIPGVFELVERLKGEGYKQCIVTSRTTESTLRYLELFDKGHLFDGLVTCDDTDKHKPGPEPILLALDKMGCEKEEALMVGDGVFDIKCANNAGVKSVLVGWRITGSGSEVIKDAVQDYEAETPEELLEIIKSIK